MSAPSSNTSRRELLQAGALGAGAAALSGGLAHASPAPRPNIVLIVLDQLTERLVSAHGRSPIETPGLDRLVAKGTSFTESYCADPSCSPARASMMTGRPSSEHGVLLNRLSLRDDIPTIGAWMRSEAGYKTWYAGKWHIVGRLVHTDFEIPNRGTLFGEASDLSVLRSFEGKLSQYSEDTPFFAVVSLLNPHDIAEWVKMEWPRAEVSCKDMGISDLPEMPPNFMTQHPEAALHKKIRRNTNLRDRWSPMKWQFYLWWYYRQVEMVDGVLNRLLDLIWNSRYGHNTVVMLTSDHGDLQGEHGLIMKQSLYEAAARVPLMVAWPGVLPQGTVDRKHLVSGLDVVPTICDFAGIAPPPKTRGASLRGLLKKTPGTWREFLQIQSAVEGRMIRTERYKHIQYRNDAQEQLFLLQEDPWELQDLSADSNHQGMRATMQDLQRQAEAELEPTTLSTSGYGAAWAATR